MVASASRVLRAGLGHSAAGRLQKTPWRLGLLIQNRFAACIAQAISSVSPPGGFTAASTASAFATATRQPSVGLRAGVPSGRPTYPALPAPTVRQAVAEPQGLPGCGRRIQTAGRGSTGGDVDGQ